MAILVDTGVLLAAADTDDQDHQLCASFLKTTRDELLVAAPVLPETSWQIERNLGPRSEAAFIRLITTRRLTVIDLTIEDWERCADLIEAYADLGLGLVDASIVAIAERLGVTTIATLNSRDFSVVRPEHCDTFELVP